jgi:hypothetical protein
MLRIYCHITHGFWREIKLNSFLQTIESLVILSSNYFVQYQHATFLVLFFLWLATKANIC